MSQPAFKPPISLTPRLLSDLPADNPGIASLHRALEECSNIARELGISREVTLSDELKSDIAKERDIRDHGNGALIGADKILDIALKKADGEIAKIESKLAKTLPALEEGSHSAEIRAHVKNLPDKQRRAFILAAQESDDNATLAAVISAPAFLSGLSDAALSTVHERRSEAAAKANPLIVRQLEILKTARGRVQLARQSLNAERRRAFDGSQTVSA